MVGSRIGRAWVDSFGAVHFSGGFGTGSPREFFVSEPAVTALTADELQERERIEQELGAAIMAKLDEMIAQALAGDMVRATASLADTAPGSVCAVCGGRMRWVLVPCPYYRPGRLVAHYGWRCVECGAVPDGDG